MFLLTTWKPLSACQLGCNRPLFNRVARRLRGQGYEILNPAENEDGGVV